MYTQNDQSAQDIIDKFESDNDILKEDNLKEFLSNSFVQCNISRSVAITAAEIETILSKM